MHERLSFRGFGEVLLDQCLQLSANIRADENGFIYATGGDGGAKDGIDLFNNRFDNLLIHKGLLICSLLLRPEGNDCDIRHVRETAATSVR